VAGATSVAVIPWAYVVISILSLVAFQATRSYRWFAISQFTPYPRFPFFMMWGAGGFVAGSVSGVWASLGPITALLLGHLRAGAALLVLYVGLVAGSLLVPAATAAAAPPTWLQDLFLVLNLTAVPLVGWLLVRLFVGGRESTLASVRSVVRQYFSDDLANILLADPTRAELGGQIADVTVLFADLGSYSTWSEKRAPTEVVAMLNRYFGAALPAIHEHGGVPVQLAGDAVMAVFGAPHPQPDHAIRACRAALAILDRTQRLATGPEAGPQFHVGLNSGPALVGNIGSEEYRNFTAIGDTTNLAARLQGVARPGEVVIGPLTAAGVGSEFQLTPLGPVRVKGRVEAAEVYRLHPR
jgi:class 3 adenylate cyclase